MRTEELRRLTLALSAAVRARCYVPDMDLGKSEHLGESRELAQAYEARARPLLEIYRARGLLTDDELASLRSPLEESDALADQLQVLAETIPPG